MITQRTIALTESEALQLPTWGRKLRTRFLSHFSQWWERLQKKINSGMKESHNPPTRADEVRWERHVQLRGLF